MTVKELIEKLSMYRQDAKVVLECEHDHYTGHDVREVRVSTAFNVTIGGTLDYVANFMEEDYGDE